MHNYLVYPGVTISSARRIARARISVPGDRQGFDARAVKALNDLADEYDALAALVQTHAEAANEDDDKPSLSACCRPSGAPPARPCMS
jgi:hypothetical protein